MVVRAVGIWLVVCFASAAALLMPGVARAQPELAAPDQYTLVRCGTLLDVPGKPARSHATLVIKNDRVLSVFDGWDDSDGALTKAMADSRAAGAEPVRREIDLKDAFVCPGLIDCHVHLTNVWDATVRARMPVETPEFVAVRSTYYARITLEAGFTTVRDLGANSPQSIFALRDAINQGLVVGPRILAAGHWIAITGGHGDHTNGFRADLIPQPTPDDGIADGPDECTKAVRNQIKLGADLIKVTATGGVLSASSAGLAQHFTDPELSAIVHAAHAMGRKVAAHAHGTDGINASIRAGVDSIEHGTYLDDESIKLFKERAAAGTPCYHVPTLLAAATVADNATKRGYYLPVVAAKALQVGPRAKEMFKASHEAGVKIAFGTDTGVSLHGLNAREFKLMVDAGMTPAEAIIAATITASELLGLEREIGTLEAGKAADLIAVKGDPLKDVTEFERVAWVMKGGVVVKGTRP